MLIRSNSNTFYHYFTVNYPFIPAVRLLSYKNPTHRIWPIRIAASYRNFELLSVRKIKNVNDRRKVSLSVCSNFSGHTEYLRGCMADIMYNGIRVIEYARHRRNSTEAIAVSWGCSAEFDASARADISFVEDGAFTVIPRLIPRNGSR